MYTKVKNIIFYLIIIFAIYCALIIGQSWDEETYIFLGNERLNYLLSFGANETHEALWGRFFPGISYTLKAFVISLFPGKFEFEINHLFNLIISISVVFGISKITRELFNKKVSVIIFVIFIIYPVYFGHMAINANDTIVASANIWITYLVLRYLKNQIDIKRNKYVILIAISLAFGTGVRLVFIGSILPLLIFILSDIFFFKKFTSDTFSKKIFFYDLFKIIIISYLIIILFWVPAHTNIFILPLRFFLESISVLAAGWPLILIDGEYYFSNNAPKFYLFINLFFKTPEYLLFLYFLFFLFIFGYYSLFNALFKNFIYKLIFVLVILLFPNIILLFKILPVYDGLRLYLYSLPFFLIIPALTIFILMVKIKKIKIRILAFFTFLLFVVFFIKFLSITPYHYVYLNSLSGKFENQEKRFENDYWGTSLKELIKKSKFLNDNFNNLALCGVSKNTVKYYLKKNDFSKVNVVGVNEKYDYIIMTNRAIFDGNIESLDLSKAKTCFDKYIGSTKSSVKRYGLTLSQIKENHIK